jgi:hypothetical protein
MEAIRMRFVVAKWKLVPTLTLVSLAATARAQTPAPSGPVGETATWTGLGAGASSAGLMLQLDLSSYRNERLLRGRLAGYSTLTEGTTDLEGIKITELSVLGGAGTLVGRNWGSFVAGGGVLTGAINRKKFTTVGVSAEASLISWRRPHVALNLFGNVNPKRSFAGGSISLLIGHMPFADGPPLRLTGPR